MLIRIIKPLQSIGYDVDCNIYKKFIEEHYPGNTVVISDSSIRLNKKDDVHIYISNAQRQLTQMAKIKIIMINHELFLHHPSELEMIKHIDFVLCRTHIGYEVAAETKKKYGLKYEIIYTKFTSMFPTIEIKKIHNMILHSAGEHYWKQTDAVIKAWKNNSTLPMIIITCSGQCYNNIKEIIKNDVPANMRLYDNLIEKERFTRLKNGCGIHLCPSIVEGYGHYINEARKVRSLIVTSNYPPMNELVSNDTGILVDCTEYGKKRNGAVLCFIDQMGIKDGIIRAINTDYKTRENMIENGYIRYENDTKYFNKTMKNFFDNSIHTNI